MKRFGNLFAHVFSFENLLLASRRARQGCGWGEETSRFFYHQESELLLLQAELRQGCYQPGPYRFFEVREPKYRNIAVAPFRDRVVHHAVVAVLTPIFEKNFIHDSYATRTGKGTHRAVRRAQSFTRRWPWYLKMDVEKFFDSVDHDILLGLLAHKIKDKPLLILLEKIIRNATLSGIGLPIGNLTSQFLANVYLDPLDHLVKDCWGVKAYLRYMDDFSLFAFDKKKLLDIQPEIEDFLADRLRLRLKPESIWLNRSSHGLSFLGLRIFPKFIRVRPKNRRRSLKRMQCQLSAWTEGNLTEEHMVRSLDSITGHLAHFCPGVRIPTNFNA